jgi:hypothetical protein
MLTLWTKHIKDQEAKENFERQIINSIPVLERIQDILKEDLDTLDKVEFSTKAYDNPNWAYRQAHVNGYKTAYKNLDKLLNLDLQKELK